MAVTKFGKIYYADYHDAAGVRRRISLQTQNKLVAQQKFKELLRRRAAIKERIVIHISWDNFKEKLYHYMKMEKNRNTISRTRLAIKHLEDVHKPRFLQDVTPEFVQKVKESMIQKGFKNANINRLVGSLKTAMHLGEKWQLVPKQNWAVIPKLKVPRGRVVFHTPEEIDKILAACPNEKKDYLTGNYPLIAKSVGISSFLHKLRHTFASQLGQNGVELYTVSKLLGHRNIQTTEIYAHLTPETMQKAVTHLPKHNSPALHIEAKTVCAPDKACLQLSTDLSDYVKKLYILFSLYKQQIIGKKLKLFIK